jgi:DNA-binding beta-propeller fold protein YncE
VFVVNAGSARLGDRTGVVVLRPNGTVSGWIGRYGNYDGQFLDPHWVAVARSGAVYVADFEGRRVQKFVPAEPSRAQP